MKKKAKEFLRQVKIMDSKINACLNVIGDLRAKATSIRSTSDLSHDMVVSSPTKDKIGEFIDKIIDMEEKLNSQIDDYVDYKDETLRLISMLDDDVYIKILTMRYFEYLSWEEISVNIRYSYRQTTRLHGKALYEFQKILDKEKGG